MTETKKYEELTVPIVLSWTGVLEALVECWGRRRPKLVVSADLFLSCNGSFHDYLNTSCDPDLGPTEWYVEWNGKRVGSIGC
jgi:hypothetical protein